MAERECCNCGDEYDFDDCCEDACGDCLSCEHTRTKFIWPISILLSIGLLLLVILLPMSFSYIERDEMGFKKNTVSNNVDKSKVYLNGRYFWGVGKTPVTFPATYKFVELSGINVFVSGGQTMQVSAQFYYRLKPATLAQLYETYGLAYEDRIESIAKAEIRNAAALFSVDQYIMDRKNITAILFNRVSSEIASKAFVEVPQSHFFLKRVYLPPTILSRKTQIFMTTQEQITANYSFQASQVRLETSKQVTELLNQKLLVEQAAKVESERITADANSRAFQRIETEKGVRMKDMISLLGIASDNVTSTLLLLNSLLDSSGTPTLLAGISGAILQSP